MFSMKAFICGFKYVKSRRYKSRLINFLLGQAKMAIYVTRKEKIDMNINKSLVAVFFKLVKARILIDLFYYKSIHDLLMFETIWCLNGILCEVVEEEMCFYFLVMLFRLVQDGSLIFCGIFICILYCNKMKF